MKFRIIFTLIALAVIAAGYMLVGGNTQPVSSDPVISQPIQPAPQPQPAQDGKSFGF